MSRMFGLVDNKVQEAEYFLERIINAKSGFFGVQCDTVAFTASARSITFAMQSSLNGIPEFEKWYQQKQEELKADHLSRFFHDFRRISVHIGDNAVIGGTYQKGKAIYYFGKLPDLQNIPDLDVVSACSTYFKTILELVFECYVTFPTLINGQWRFTKDFFNSINKTIDDAEEELGVSAQLYCG